MNLGLVLISLSFFSLFFALFKLLSALKLLKQYKKIKEKVLSLKLKNNSKTFIRENLISEGFREEVVIEVIEEVFFGIVWI